MSDAGYIGAPEVADADTLAVEMLAYLSDNIPGFVPHDGNLEVWTVVAVCLKLAEVLTVGTRVPKAIFRWYGQSVIGLPPVAAAPATTTTTWTMVDDLGYTIPAGTVVGFQTAGDVVANFEVAAEVTVPPGSTSTEAGEVVIHALAEGAGQNGISAGVLVVVDALGYVSAVVSEAATSGGVDAEDDDAYLNRLSAELRLSSPRPILAADFAVLARRVAGVYRAVAIDLYWPGRVFADGVTVNTSPTLTSPALASFTADDVGRTVAGTGVPGGATIIAYANATTVTMSANATSSGSGRTITLGPRTDAERAVTLAMVDAAGVAVTSPVKAEVVAVLEALREVNFHVDAVDPTSNPIDVTYTVVAQSGVDKVALKTAIDAALAAYLAPGVWAGGGEVPPVWRNEVTVRYLEVAEVINRVLGVDYISTLTVNAGTTNVVMAGVAALPAAGVITGTVT